jgi:hypothetical protein
MTFDTHITQRTLNRRLLSRTLSCDVASSGLAASSRHVVQRTLNPRVLSYIHPMTWGAPAFSPARGPVDV